jgi:arabinofuranosyltransferase
MSVKRGFHTPLALVLLAVFLAAFLRTAWISDDAYITFRTIDNFLGGHGLRWNVVERVQSYTHPLWLFFLVPWHWVAGEAYFSTLAASIALSLVVVWLLARQAESVQAGMMVFVALLFSRAFLDYATSGLENPLTNLLVAALLGLTLRTSPPMPAIALLTSLLLLARLDLAVLVAPAVLMAAVRTAAWRQPGFLFGFAPFAAWELFSVLYYGFPFPNTAYAKLKTGIGAAELVPQGALYLLDSLQRDPVTLLTICAALAASVASRPRRTWPIAAGIVGYLAYVVWIGGDFMSGRFLVAPLIGAAVLLLRMEPPARAEFGWAPAVVFVAILAAFAPNPMPQVPGQTPRPDLVGESGIADERLVYFPTSGLPYFARGIPWPADAPAERGRQARRDGTTWLSFCCVGTMGYFAGPDVYVIDEVGLSDPLLARLPSERPWRIGHFQRRLPDGYIESIETGENKIRHPEIAVYYEHLRTITRAPLLDGRRLRSVLRMNLGRYESLLAR